MGNNHEPLDSFELSEDQGLLDDFEQKPSKIVRARLHGVHWLQSLRPFRHGTDRRGVLFAQAGVLLVVFTITFAFFLGRRHVLGSTNENDQVSNSEVHVGNQLAIPLHPRLHATRDPTTLTFDWNITKGRASPDGVEKTVYLVNGMFPGPTIEARSGDRIIVHAHNGLRKEGLALHWHGLQMKGYNAMDGAAGFTQCPVPPGKDFTYDFTIGAEEHGTFWWHSHSQLQRGDGLYGGFIVHRPVHHPLSGDDAEALLLVGDWFHRQQIDVFATYNTDLSFGEEPLPDGLVVNGHGQYNCPLVVLNGAEPCTEQIGRDVLPLLQLRAKTRLRVVNTGTISGLSFMVDGATLRAIALDGGCPVETPESHSIGILYPGERVDVMLEWKEYQFSSRPLLNLYLDDENFGLRTSTVNLNYTFPALPSTRNDSTVRQPARPLPETDDTHLNLTTITSSTIESDFEDDSNAETILFYAKTQLLSEFGGRPLGFMNATSWQPQFPPLLSLNRSSWNDRQNIQFVGVGSTPKRVNIIINNLDDGAHPFHLHGNHFYVLSSFEPQSRAEKPGIYNPYDPERDQLRGWINYKNPIRKDTVSVPSMGHVLITFTADNPGLWLLHCHMLVHMGSGMAAGIQIGQEDDYEHIRGLDSSALELCNLV